MQKGARNINQILFYTASPIFFAYNTVIFYFSQKYFLKSTTGFTNQIPYILLNYGLVVLYYYFDLGEVFLGIGFFVLLYMEFTALFKNSLIKTLFGTAAFSLNLMALRIIIFSLYSLYNGIDIHQAVTVTQNNIMCTSMALGIACVYMFIFDNFFTTESVLLINSSVQNLKFAAAVFLPLYLYIIINLGIISDPHDYGFLPWLMIKVGVCIIATFMIIMWYALTMSRLQNYKRRSGEIESELSRKKNSNVALESIAFKDPLTDCYNRSYAIRELEQAIDLNINFYVVFIDIDGLKFVNDNYGHTEGDKYIHNIVSILREEFKKGLLCRIGGDEFLVILKKIPLEEVEMYASAACKSANKLYVSPECSYQMSLSYGIESYKPGMTYSQLLEQADKKMYHYKKLFKTPRTS